MKLSRLRKILFPRGKDYWLFEEANSLLHGCIINLREENAQLKRGNDILKNQHQALLEEPDSQLKKDLGEAINVIIDYQKTLFRLRSPDPNVQRANNLLNKYNVKSERVHGQFKILAGGKDITMGREF